MGCVHPDATRVLKAALSVHFCSTHRATPRAKRQSIGGCLSIHTCPFRPNMYSCFQRTSLWLRCQSGPPMRRPCYGPVETTPGRELYFLASFVFSRSIILLFPFHALCLSLCIWITLACPSLDAPPEVKSPLIYYIRHVSVFPLAGRISPFTNSECSSKPKPCHVCVSGLTFSVFS